MPDFVLRGAAQGTFATVPVLLIPPGMTAWLQHIDSTVPESSLTIAFRNGQTVTFTLKSGAVVAYDGDLYASVTIGTATVNTRWALVPNGTPSPLGTSVPQYLKLLGTSDVPIPVVYDGTVAPPTTGVWRGYAVSIAAGAVAITSISGESIVLGTATAGGQAFGFAMGVTEGSLVTLTNCKVNGGVVST